MEPPEQHYHVFLSYNRSDTAAVELIACRLRDEADLVPFLNAWNLVPGELWHEELEQALDASQSCVVFL